MAYHGMRQGSGVCQGLYMEVAEHFVEFPTAE